ncbi:MAG TPA: PhaM family polyhydroxyalkanoate granule multifunctional regulatory protein [Rhodocyclaceae bacterium]|nr:PhaM family polyhydroxyalkanoate granule multifunctional regulatory protein [Rhodocyclaceae bacterium]
MSNLPPDQDPLEFMKSFWGNLGFPLPGMVTPTVDTDELGRRITDLKAVEGWLKTNLSMLQMTIQGLEMQRATLATLQTMSQAAGSREQNANPFANPSLWPWNFMQSSPAAEAPAQASPEPQPEPSTKSSTAKRKPKG